MYRFVAFVWNNDVSGGELLVRRMCERLRTAEDGWRSIINVPGLTVYQVSRGKGAYRAYLLGRDGGVILGKLFARAGTGHTNSESIADDYESDQIHRTQGRRLVDQYWGHYVAFIREDSTGRTFVLRDPTGGLQCFITTAGSVTIILSDLNDYSLLNESRLNVDWNHLTAFMVDDRIATRTTGFKEVSMLYPGECVSVDKGKGSRSFYWSPSHTFQQDQIEDPVLARERLRSDIRNCIRAWASCYRSVVLELSGGLDSTIVAASLAKSGTPLDVLCFHFYTDLSQGDERKYARLAAEITGYELFESGVSALGISLERQLEQSRVATPVQIGFTPGSEIKKRQLVLDRQAGAVFTGQGGDHLFQQSRNKNIAAEYLQRHGMGPGFFAIASDVSRLTSESLWSVVGAAINYGIFRRSFDPYAIYSTPGILTAEASVSLDPHLYRHPWVKDCGRLPASKQQQVFSIVDCQAFYLFPCACADQIHPLISQPIIETCLQIPTYVLAYRGRERGLVREAFQADIPATIANRHSKGITSSYFNQLMVNNVNFLRDFLLNGALVREGILDRGELETSLSQQALVRGSNLQPLLAAVRAEAWLKNWANLRLRSAA